MLRLRASLLLAFSLGISIGCSDDDPAPRDSGVDTSTIDGPMVCSGGAKGYLQMCTADTECGDCMCHSFGHSMVCTKTCTTDPDCPAPSGGCTQGFCRP